jgi:hypothetical protein
MKVRVVINGKHRAYLLPYRGKQWIIKIRPEIRMPISYPVFEGASVWAFPADMAIFPILQLV